MCKINFKKIHLLFFIVLILFSLNLNSQITVNITVDRQTIPINESLTLVLTISGEDATSARVDMPPMSNFNVYSSGKSSNISIINGRISSSVEYTYVLSPRYIGKTKIPSISVFTGKEKILTKEIEITVVKSNNQTQTSQQPQQYQHTGKQNIRNVEREKLFFIKANVDKQKAYPGEQINLTIGFYTAIPIASNPQYLPPKINNLISEDMPPAKNGEVVIDNIRYYYTQLKTALFGIQPGLAYVGPAQVIVQVQKEEDIDPFDPNFIQKFFSGFANVENVKLNTKKLNIEILPLPEPQPPDFSGAVGNFFISADVDRKEAKQGEAINFTVKISGRGNIKIISKPKFESNEFKIYDTLVSDNITKNNDIIGGEKRFTYIISTRDIGIKEIPSIKFVFFNPETKKYEEIKTQPIKIKIIEGEANKTYDFANTVGSSPTVTKLSSDIRYIFEKNKDIKFIRNSVNKIASISFYFSLLGFIPILLSFILSKAEKEKLSNPFLYAFKNAESKLNSQLKDAQKIANENLSKSLTLVYDGIIDYLTAKLKENIYSLPTNKIIENIKSKYPKINEYAIEELKSIFDEIEFYNYTPSQLDIKKVHEIINKIKALIEILEKEF